MKIISKIAVALVGLILLSGITLFLAMPKQSSAPKDITGPKELDAYFEKITHENMPPSLSICVIKDGIRVYKKAFGYTDVAGTRPTRTDTIYPWWSVTKLATSVAVLQLVEDGRIGLDDPLTDYLPDYVVIGTDGEPVTITIRQMLNHTSGLPDFMPEGLVWIHAADQEPINQTEFVRENFVGRYRQLDFEPDTDAVYTNVGYVLMGVVVETVSGQSYESYVRDNILIPLGMNDTAFIRSSEQQERTAVGSMPVLNMYSALMWVFGDDDFFVDYIREKTHGRFWMKPLYTDYTPSTGLSGPAEDLAAFGEFLMSGTAPNGVGVLDQATIEAMQIKVPLEKLPTRYRMVHNFGFGLEAWKIDGRRVYGHGGGGPGFGTIMAFLPDEKLVIAVNANDTSIDRDELLRVLASVNW